MPCTLRYTRSVTAALVALTAFPAAAQGIDPPREPDRSAPVPVGDTPKSDATKNDATKREALPGEPVGGASDAGATPKPSDPSVPGTGVTAPLATTPATSAAATGEGGAGEANAEALPPPPPAPPSGESPKRAVPDYDNRGDDPTTAGDVLIWVPRVLFSPVYLLTEYVIRRPLEWLISTAERKHWPQVISDFFVFGENKNAGIYPTALLDLGFRFSVGFYAFWNDALGKGNHLRLHFSTYGSDWLQAAVADKIPVGKDAFFDMRLEGVHRPDQVFHGIGPRSLQSDRSRYGIDKIQVRPVFEATWWKGSRVTIEGGVRYVNFREDACCGDPSLETRVEAGTFANRPPAYDSGYTAAFQRGELTIDTRDPRPASQTGLRVELEVEQASNLRKSASNWLRYGGSVGGFVDIKHNRTLSLSVTTLFVDPLTSNGEIPFTEQILLGGSGPMRGYLYGRLNDRSAAIATLKYRWPIWVFLDGTIQGALGNVFNEHLSDFHPDLLRLSAAVGLESVGTPDNTFEVLLGLGTETIEHGMNVNSVRLLFGTNRGF